jgi:AhpD family alkylhydroperoxidase
MNTDYKTLIKNLTTGSKNLGNDLPIIAHAMNGLILDNLKDTVLSGKQKELIALGIAIALRCESCLALHIASALRLQSSHEEIMDAVGVAIVVTGGVAIPMGIKATEILKQLESKEGATQ